MGFSLAALIDRYLYTLAPQVQGYTRNEQGVRVPYWLSVVEFYNNILKICEGQSKASKAHKEELFGSASPQRASQEYDLLSIAKELHIPFPTFMSYHIRDRAKMVAHHILSNMADVVRRHEEAVARNLKKLEEKNGQKKN